MADIKDFKDHFIVLLETGFIAVNHADEDSALKLFKAAELLNPENTLPKVGLGYLHLHKLELKQAANMFKAVVDKEPNNEMAKAFLGLCLSLTPDQGAEGEKILASAAKSSNDDGVKHLAEDAMQFVEKFVKKSPSPAEVQKPKEK